MAGDLNTRIIISARDDASTVFLSTAKNLGVVGDAAKSVSQSLGGAISTEVVARKMAELTGNLASVSRFSQAAGKDVKLLDGQLATLASQAGLTQKEFAGLYGQMMKTQASKAAADSLRAIGEAAGLSQREVVALGRRMGLAGDSIKQATDKVSVATSGMEAMASVARKLGAVVATAFTVNGLWEYSKSVGQTKMEFEAFERTLKAVTGSQSAAVSAMQSLTETSSALGLRLMDASGSYKTLAAAARGTTLEGVGAKQTFEAVAQAASVLGMSAGDTSSVMLALGQMISKGKVYSEELRGQLGERLPGAFQLAARAMGVTTAELDKMLSSGGVVTDVFLPKFAAELKKAFESEAAAAGNSGQAAFNRLQNSWDSLKLSLADTGSWDIAVAAANKLGKIAEAAAYSIRLATGSLQGAQKVYALEGDISRKKDEIAAIPETSKKANIYVRTARSLGLSEDPADTRRKLQGELEDLQRQLREEAQKIEDSAREQFGRQQQNVITSGYNKQLEAIKGGEKAVLDAWASSSDKKLAVWATSQKEMREAYDRAAKGEITQSAMEVLVSESQKKYGDALGELAKKGQKAGETARKSSLEISEAMNKALGASESWTGDAWSGKFRQLLADLDKDLKAAKTPIEEYWAYWEYGAKKARVEFDQWIDSIKRAGELESQIGQLSFDPGRQLAGDRAQLAADWQQAVKAAGENQEEIARVNELFQLKEVELREKSLGDLAALEDGYFERRKKGLEAQFEYLKKQGVNEHALAVHMAQERDKLNKEQLEKRLGYEDDFASYLMDRLNLQYGLYKSAESRKLELWEKTADATIKLFDGVNDSVSWALGQVGGDLLTNKFKDVATYTEQLLAQLKQTFATWLTEMIRLAASRYIVYPILGQVVGTSGSLSLPGVSGMNVQGGDGISLESAGKYLGYGKDAYNLLGGAGGMGIDALSATSTNAFTSSLANGGSIQMANVSASNATAAASGGFSAALGPAAAAGGLGYAFGGMVRPDNPTASYVGAGAGVLAGGIAGMAGLGMLSATGVGALVAIPAALIAGLATPNTTKSSWNTQPGSGQAVMVVGGDVVPASYGVLKQTTSGMFGSSSTKHQTVFQAVTGQMAEQEKALWDKATAGVFAFTDAVGISADQVKDATKDFVFPLTAVPEGTDPSVVFGNVATAMTEVMLENLGMKGAVQAVAIEGESWVDTLTRISTALQAADAVTLATGFDFERLTGSMDKIQAGNYISRLAESAGGVAEVQTSLGLMTAHTMTAAQRAEAAVANATSQADSRLIALGVSFEDFWDRMQETMSGPVDPDVAASWMTASKLVDQLNTLQKTLDAVNSAAKQFDASLSARALSAQGLTYQAQAVSMLAAQEAELTQARIDGATAAQLSRIAEVQAMEQAALARQRAEQGDSIRSGLSSRIATATGDSTYWMTEAVANRQKDYFKLVWDYGYELADMSNRAYDTEIQARLASEAEAVRLSREAFALDIRTRQLTLAGKADEAGAAQLVAEQAEQYRNAIASGLGADDLSALLQVQRDELEDYWDKLVDNLKSAADAIRKTLVDMRSGDKSPLPVDQRYVLARAQFDADVAKGLTGDRAAITEAQSLVPGLLDALMATTADKNAYTDGFNEITAALARLADVLVGENQKSAIAQAESSYNQARSQAAAAYSNTFEGRLAAGLASTGVGWQQIAELPATGYAYTGGLSIDAYLKQNPANVSSYLGWYLQNYGTGSGVVDWGAAMETTKSLGLLDPSVMSLYQAMQAALDNLKAVRGFAAGGISSGPQLAMVSEGTYREEAHVPLPDGRTIPVTLRGGDGNASMLAELRQLREELRQLRQEAGRGQFEIARNTLKTAKFFDRAEVEGVLTRAS